MHYGLAFFSAGFVGAIVAGILLTPSEAANQRDTHKIRLLVKTARRRAAL